MYPASRGKLLRVHTSEILKTKRPRLLHNSISGLFLAFFLFFHLCVLFLASFRVDAPAPSTNSVETGQKDAELNSFPLRARGERSPSSSRVIVRGSSRFSAARGARPLKGHGLRRGVFSQTISLHVATSRSWQLG